MTELFSQLGTRRLQFVCKHATVSVTVSSRVALTVGVDESCGA